MSDETVPITVCVVSLFAVLSAVFGFAWYVFIKSGGSK